ncbi:MAG TPA: response regulator transcription factor [Rhodoglobus sp.]|nr:response regulator transcription factor [Rhodoglobus sp.]
MENRPVRVLVVDEEEALSTLVTLALELEGWQVRTAATAAEALDAAASFAPDIVLLDMGLPDAPGTDVVAAMRADGSTAAVVFLTGRAEHEHRAAAFAAGADDYLTKPFGLEEVVDRLQPIVRRLGLAPTSRRLDDLVVDVSAGQVWRGDVAIPLTPLEFELLRELVERPGTRLSVGQLVTGAARRGIRVPREFVTRMLERLREVVNADRRPLLWGDDAGWMLA